LRSPRGTFFRRRTATTLPCPRELVAVGPWMTTLYAICGATLDPPGETFCLSPMFRVFFTSAIELSGKPRASQFGTMTATHRFFGQFQECVPSPRASSRHAPADGPICVRYWPMPYVFGGSARFLLETEGRPPPCGLIAIAAGFSGSSHDVPLIERIFFYLRTVVLRSPPFHHVFPTRLVIGPPIHPSGRSAAMPRSFPRHGLSYSQPFFAASPFPSSRGHF